VKGSRSTMSAPGNPADVLRALVGTQTGPSRAWHVDNLYHHEPRYLADLQLIDALAPAGPVLEVGSAPCHMTALLQLAGHAVIGVDAHPERVADFIRSADLDIRRCDIERAALPFEDASFSCALLCETFEHLRIDPAFVLSEINRVLRPGAPLLLTTPNVYSLPSLGRFLLGRSVADPVQEFGKLRGIGHMGHVREYSAREVARFLESSGFALQSVSWRHYAWPTMGVKRRLLRLAYRLTPRRFHRDIVIVARKAVDGPRLVPLVPDCSGIQPAGLPPLPAPAANRAAPAWLSPERSVASPIRNSSASASPTEPPDCARTLARSLRRQVCGSAASSRASPCAAASAWPARTLRLTSPIA
jgi:SAM-dependent methyltransferase